MDKLINHSFEEYYEKTGNTATHIFVYSKKQDERSYGKMLDGKETYLNGERYSEMRSRDYRDKIDFNNIDIKFIGVGTYDDVVRK